MYKNPKKRQSPVALALFMILDPIPYSFFVAALIFDIIYARSGEVLWVKSAAWLITFGLVLAIPPRIMNLFYIWRPSNKTTKLEKMDFWLNGFAIIAAILNAFVHSRDAYAAVPDSVWLSVLTVCLQSLGIVLIAVHCSMKKGAGNE